MREGDHARAQHCVQEWYVAQDGDECRFEEQSEVGIFVSHALLRDGQVSSLADEQIRPLYAHNGDEVAALGVVERLDGPADVVGADVRPVVEVRYVVILRPSACVPIRCISISEE